jgi:hypothetical protein
MCEVNEGRNVVQKVAMNVNVYRNRLELGTSWNQRFQRIVNPVAEG